ncbi:Ran guanine nucleotide release factor [Seminavis robusta]|uniref:Ran guanine nucleotide release factor n=1 Tax=Seminavis robusta TaxID=568900 RepID=A0A9N8H530_9STRA|nr:Ran guanine nucleotide release factor [Seminavis robusta]|eukprot:Sro76_g041650.1 Ran guanine nucleotide release factor (187) ;mRNA; r:64059-64619
MTERSLFGGAMVCHIGTTNLDEWRDVSDVRQVPDHQECWQDIDQRVLVIEILEHQRGVENDKAAEYFFTDLATANGSSNNTFVSTSNRNLLVTGLPSTASIASGIGVQANVAMGRDTDVAGNPRQQESQSIRVELCVLRLPSVETDLLITLSTPTPNTATEEQNEFSPIFQQIVSSFQIRDWTLFE